MKQITHVHVYLVMEDKSGIFGLGRWKAAVATMEKRLTILPVHIDETGDRNLQSAPFCS